MRKQDILRGFGAFTRVIEEGRSIGGQPISLFYRRNPTAKAEFKVGFSVSRRLRRAADRNYVRRLMREAFRLRTPLGPATNNGQTGGIEAVFMYTGLAKPGKNERPSLKAVEIALDRLLTELREKISS